MPDCFVGIDWGTSNRRAYVLTADGACVRQAEDGEGMLAVRGRFPQALDALLAKLEVDPATPVLMAGMVGSAQGWQEVPYLTPDTALSALPNHLHRIAGQRFIVPGYCRRSQVPDVMRGEETQLLGLHLTGMESGWVALPGTHSKWAYLEQGRIVRWSTFMTGELFACLSQYGTLAPLLAGPAEDDAAAFDAGLALARQCLPLSHALFSVRAGVASGMMPAAHARAKVSGLLIGTEFVAMTASGLPCRTLHLLASPALRERYAQAAAAFGLPVDVVDSHAVFTGAMRHLYQQGVRDAS